MKSHRLNRRAVGRRIYRAIGAAIASALAVGSLFAISTLAVAAPASAGALGSFALNQGVSQGCSGAGQTGPQIGIVSYSLSGSNVILHVVLTKATPNSSFYFANKCVSNVYTGTNSSSGTDTFDVVLNGAAGSTLNFDYKDSGGIYAMSNSITFPSADNGPTVSCTTNGSIFNTGYNSATGGTLGSGSTDANWLVAGPYDIATPATPAAAPSTALYSPASVYIDGAYYEDPSYTSSQYIGSASGSEADYYFEYPFVLSSSVNPATFSLGLDFYADNQVAQVYVNGVPQLAAPQGGSVNDQYGGFYAGNAASTTLSSGWKAGENTIVVDVLNGGGPWAFDAQMRSSASCTPTAPSISNIPGTGSNAAAVYGNNFTATVGGTNSNGVLSITSDTAGVCTTNGTNGLTVDFVATGTCTLVSQVAQGTGYLPANGSPQSFTVAPVSTNLTWTAPAGITYGTAISTQLNAAVTPNGTSGTINYTLGSANGPAVTAGEVLPAGTETLWATFTPSSGNYTRSSTSVILPISPAPLTIAASSPPAMTYGGNVPAITASYSGFVNGDGATSLSTAPSCSTSATSSSPVASYATSCSGAVDRNYSITYVAGSLSVNPAPLNITASSASTTYGGNVPAITASYSGFVNGDSASSLSSAPTCSTSATSSSSIGRYISSCLGAVDGNYTITTTSGTVVVGAATLMITASSPSMTYGATVASIAPTYSGFVNGDSATSLTAAPSCATAATSTSHVGSYSSSCKAAVDPNYTVLYVNGVVAVTPAPLTITASGPSMIYGASVPLITASFSGFVNSDGPGQLGLGFACSTTATSGSPVTAGGYETNCAGANDSDYSVTYVSRVLTVTPAPLSISASSATINYGDTVPEITPSYSGFVNGDGESSLTTAPSCSTSAASGASVGSYDTSCSGAVDTNYTITDLDATLTVNAVALQITASSASMNYGASVPLITPSYSGFVNGDGASSLAVSSNCSEAGGVAPHVGNYDTSCSGAVDDNYTISYTDGALAVDPVVLVVTASSPQMVYGSSLPQITASYSGFVNGDNESSLTTGPSCQTSAVASSSVGSYDTSCSGAADNDYLIGYVDGSLGVTPAALSITASSGTMNYGGSVPTIRPTYSGFVNGDGAASLTSAPSCSTDARTTSHVGNYTSSCSGAADDNYSISNTNGVVVIGSDVLVVAASSPVMTYGGLVPSVTPRYSGFQNGDDASSLTTAPTCTSTASAAPNAGSYATGCSGAVDADYTIDYVGGALSVNSAPLSITASSLSMTYGGAVPTITASYNGLVNGDTASSLATAPTCQTAALTSSPVSSYETNCTGAIDSNYSISYVDGSLSVNPAPLSITASSPSMTYGGAVPAITASYNGFVNSDGAASLQHAPVCLTTALSSSPVGSYSTSCSSASDPNYTISYTNGTVLVNQANLAITASSPTMSYEGGVPAITPNYNGLVNGDSASSLTKVATCAATATNSSAPGTYSTSCSGAVDSNYTISYTPGSLNLLLVLACPNNAAYGTGQNLAGADLHGKNLKGQSFVGANFAGANLSGVNLSGANLTGANLQGADLSGVNLSGANLTGANFVGANVSGVNLQGDTAPCSDLQGANVKGSNMQNATLTGDNLSNDTLQGANLQNANLVTGLLVSANLTGVNMQGDNMTGASLNGASLTGTNTNSITWSNTVCPDGSNSSSNSGSCVGHL